MLLTAIMMMSVFIGIKFCDHCVYWRGYLLGNDLCQHPDGTEVRDTLMAPL